MSQRGIIKNSLTADIAAEHHAALFQSLYGASGILTVFDDLACTRIDDNTVSLAPGVYNLSGFGVMVDPGTTEELTIDSGTSGQDRNDLVVAEFVRNGGGAGVDTLHFTVVKGTSAATGTAVDPTLTAQDINGAGVTRQEALYRVEIVGTTLTTITQIASTVPSINLVQSDLMPVSGSNANGTYTKFPDGTMIGTRKIVIDVTGSAVYNSTAQDFPQPFIYDSGIGIEPALSITPYTTLHAVGNTNGFAKIAGKAISGTQYRWGVEFPVAPSSGSVVINISMIGRWK